MKYTVVKFSVSTKKRIKTIGVLCISETTSDAIFDLSQVIFITVTTCKVVSCHKLTFIMK